MSEANPFPKDTSRAIGIDLGTTFSAVACYMNGQPEIIVDQNGKRIVPSLVVFDKSSGARIFGDSAESYFSEMPEQVVYDVKRMIGRGFDEADIINSLDKWSFKVVRIDPQTRKVTNVPAQKGITDNIAMEVEVNGEKVLKTPTQISAYILQYLKDAAEQKLGLKDKIQDVVITVPAYFTENQKKRTEGAGKVAGFKNIRLIMEPTAAALSYAHGQEKKDVEKRIMVYDFGGGTFDVSILNYSSNKVDGVIADVVCTDGNNFLGGVDFDNIIFDYAMNSFLNSKELKQKNINITKENITAKNKRRLRSLCEQIKRNLSSTVNAKLEVPYFYEDNSLNVNITRAKFENETRHLFKKCLDKVKGCLMEMENVTPFYDDNGNLTNANIQAINNGRRKIHEVILVGGSTRIPKIQKDLKDFFKEEKNDKNLETEISMSVNPDEAVALGAAYQAAIVCGDVEISDAQSILLLDVVPLNISIETAGGVATPIVPKGTTIPAERSQDFTTYSDNQESVQINIYEGNRAEVKHNHLIGTFVLSGIAPAPRGTPKINVSCDISHSGILTVTAKDHATNKSNKISITDSRHGLTDEDIERMKEDAEKHKRQDEEFTERVNKKNELQNMIYMVQQLNDKANDQNVTDKIGELEKWVEANSNATKEEYENKINEMRTLMQELQSKTGGVPPNSDPAPAA